MAKNDSIEKYRQVVETVRNPNRIYQTKRVIQRAMHLAIIVWLLLIATLQIRLQNGDLMWFIALAIGSIVSGCVTCIDLIRGLFSFISAEGDRKLNRTLFANSILEIGSQETYANYRDYNLRILTTHAVDSPVLYGLLVALSAVLLILDFILGPNVQPSIYPIPLFLAENEGEFPGSLLLLGTSVVLGTGVLALCLVIFSRSKTDQWSLMTNEEILADARKNASEPQDRVDFTYERAIAVLTDAEEGNTDAHEVISAAVANIDRETIRVNRIIRLYRIIILVVFLIDFIIAILALQ